MFPPVKCHLVMADSDSILACSLCHAAKAEMSEVLQKVYVAQRWKNEFLSQPFTVSMR